MLNYSLSVRKNGGPVVSLIMPFSCHSNHCLIRPFKSEWKRKMCSIQSLNSNLKYWSLTAFDCIMRCFRKECNKKCHCIYKWSKLTTNSNNIHAVHPNHLLWRALSLFGFEEWKKFIMKEHETALAKHLKQARGQNWRGFLF